MKKSTICLKYSSARNFVSNFRAILGDDRVLVDSSDISKFVNDWTQTYKGGSVVCFPRTTGEVSALLKVCNAHKIGVVPQGGNTGLVGGGIGSDEELIISMAKFNNILKIDKHASVVECESGCILEELNKRVEEFGLSVPLDLGAKGSCMIGGNVSTNAGGLRLIKFGSLHRSILGLEVVLGSGTVVDMMRSLHKDNCGFPLKHLFIGSEGCLGIITKLSIALATKPTSSFVLLAKVKGFEGVPTLLAAARRGIGENLSAFEFMDKHSVDAVRTHASHIASRLQADIFPANSSGEQAPLSRVASLARCCCC